MLEKNCLQLEIRECLISSSNVVKATAWMLEVKGLFDFRSRALRQHPRKFVGCLLADPTPDGGGALELERLVREVRLERVC
jgi:hypothetical protein